MSKPHPVGIAWYAKEDYARILDIMADADQMPESFDEWRARAIEVEGQLKARGFVIVRAPVQPAAFLAWCTRIGRLVDADARCEYAADYAERTHADHRPIRVDLDGDDLRRA